MAQNEINFGNFLVKTNWLYEAIVTTCNKDLDMEVIKYNAAPMGVIFPDRDHIIIKPFLTTKTFENLQFNGCAGINFTNNIRLFYNSAIKKSEISQDDFLIKHKKNIPFLKDSQICFLVIKEKLEINKSKNRGKILFKIEEFEIIDSNITPYNRGFALVLESIIHFTRINILMKKEPKEGKKLISKILDYNKFIKRVYHGSDLEKIMNEIVQNIN